MPYRNIEKARAWQRRYNAAHKEEKKEYNREYQKKWRIKNRESYLEAQRKYRESHKKPKSCIVCGNSFYVKMGKTNTKTCSDVCSKINRRDIVKRCGDNYKKKHSPEEIKLKKQEYRKNNLEKIKIQQRKYSHVWRDTERYKKYKKEYYEKHKSEIKLRAKLHKLKNKDKYNLLRKKRRKEGDYKNTDKYWLYALARRLNVPTSIINNELLNTYKLFVILKREVKNVKTNSI